MNLFGKDEKTIVISTKTIASTILMTIGAVLALKFISEITHQLTLIGVSAFLAMALNPAVNWLLKRMKTKSRVRATGIAYVTVLTVLISFLALVLPPLVSQTTEFVKNVPSTINDFKTQDTAIARTVRKYNLDEQLDKISDDFAHKVNLAEPVISTANRALGTLVSIITVLILTFMMLVEGPLWYKRFINLMPPNKRKHRQEIIGKMYRVVTGYVNGQVLIAAIAACFAMVVLIIASTLLDVTVNVIALAGIVFIFGLIPLIGNILASALVVLFSLFASGALAIIMAVYFLLYQQIENATLQPYIQSRSNQLTPLIVFIAALIGAGFGGLLGALAAIPVAGCIRILIDNYFDKNPTRKAKA